MRQIDKRERVTRRDVLRVGGATAVAMSVVPGGMVVGANNAWAVSAKALKPESFATLVQMSRDIYPHDKLADKYYAAAVTGFDEASAKSADDLKFFEDGVAALNAASNKLKGGDYATIGWEAERVDVLTTMESSAFFQKVRGSLVTAIYNNKEVWPLFGYEGESASKGGYINRGFDDINWLDSV